MTRGGGGTLQSVRRNQSIERIKTERGNATQRGVNTIDASTIAFLQFAVIVPPIVLRMERRRRSIRLLSKNNVQKKRVLMPCPWPLRGRV